jgi:DNA-directed RNA polymerase subunit M/transcription elongation factor TFIIS
MSLHSFRKKGIKSLETVLQKQNNVRILEKNIYNHVTSNYRENTEDVYKDFIYQVIGDINSKKKLRDIVNDITKGRMAWKHRVFDKYADQIIEQNNFIKNPFDVEEGVFQCKKCGSRRVFSFSKQVRGLDEGTCVFAECVNCKTKWREKG